MESPQELADVMEKVMLREQELERIYNLSDEAGRLALAATDPEFREYLEFKKSQESIIEAQRSAIRNEGNIIIF